MTSLGHNALKDVMGNWVKLKPLQAHPIQLSTELSFCVELPSYVYRLIMMFDISIKMKNQKLN